MDTARQLPSSDKFSIFGRFSAFCPFGSTVQKGVASQISYEICESKAIFGILAQGAKNCLCGQYFAIFVILKNFFEIFQNRANAAWYKISAKSQISRKILPSFREILQVKFLRNYLKISRRFAKSRENFERQNLKFCSLHERPQQGDFINN